MISGFYIYTTWNLCWRYGCTLNSHNLAFTTFVQTHHQPKYIYHHPPPPTTSQSISTTTHHHPAPAKIYPPLPTICQKMDRHHTKSKIYSYITSFRHCFNSSFFFKMQYYFPWWRFCVIKFWSVCFLNSKFLLDSEYILQYFKVYIFKV